MNVILFICTFNCVACGYHYAHIQIDQLFSIVVQERYCCCMYYLCFRHHFHAKISNKYVTIFTTYFITDGSSEYKDIDNTWTLHFKTGNMEMYYACRRQGRSNLFMWTYNETIYWHCVKLHCPLAHHFQINYFFLCPSSYFYDFL